MLPGHDYADIYAADVCHALMLIRWRYCHTLRYFDADNIYAAAGSHTLAARHAVDAFSATKIHDASALMLISIFSCC